MAARSHSAAIGVVKTKHSSGSEASTTIANAGGPLSDGPSYHFNIRDEDNAALANDNPWLFGIAKSLGGSTVIFEHGRGADDENGTAPYLQVNF